MKWNELSELTARATDIFYGVRRPWPSLGAESSVDSGSLSTKMLPDYRPTAFSSGIAKLALRCSNGKGEENDPNLGFSLFASRKRDFAVPPELANILFLICLQKGGLCCTAGRSEYLVLRWVWPRRRDVNILVMPWKTLMICCWIEFFDLVREAKCEIGSPWKASKILRWKTIEYGVCGRKEKMMKQALRKGSGGRATRTFSSYSLSAWAAMAKFNGLSQV